MATKRTLVRTLVDEGFAKVSEVCRAVGLSRSSFYMISQRSLEGHELERQAVVVSREHSRYGYRRVTAMLRRAGHQVNEKRVQAVCRKHGLQVRKKQKGTRQIRENESKRLSAQHRNHVWSWDFVHDQIEWERAFGCSA